jgi:hypothetical protein
MLPITGIHRIVAVKITSKNTNSPDLSYIMKEEISSTSLPALMSNSADQE